ncbi:hypothetical protein [Psychrobacter sp. I-STPA10]|uniref:hypothetical protein n=1 Tax=Psychrobacter sp. I-STPA10 TaxID=2585769 RepID=UPI001E2A3EB7|nr:hypothetical protein [Psychrobacter sp. I-STPA10]
MTTLRFSIPTDIVLLMEKFSVDFEKYSSTTLRPKQALGIYENRYTIEVEVTQDQPWNRDYYIDLLTKLRDINNNDSVNIYGFNGLRDFTAVVFTDSNFNYLGVLFSKNPNVDI